MYNKKLFKKVGIIFLVFCTVFLQLCTHSQINITYAATKTAVDTKPPTAPQELAVAYKTYTSMTLSWSKSYDETGVKGYQVYRDGKKIISTSKTIYTNTDLIPGRNYTYTVKAYDAAGNLSDYSNVIIVASMIDSQMPTSPAGLTVSSVSFTTVSLAWKPSSDNSGIKGYEIYCNGKKTAKTSATCYVSKGYNPGSVCTFYIKAYDIAGNYSIESNSVTITTKLDEIAPSIPKDLKASSISETEVDLAWSPSSDNVKIKGYDIFCNGTRVGSTSKTNYCSKKLIPGKSYTYHIKAIDSIGNISGSSSQLTIATIKDTQAPKAPSGLKVKAVNGSSVTLSWKESTDNVKLKEYEIFCNGAIIATSTKTTRKVKCPGSLGIYVFWIRAFDIADNQSESSNSVSVFVY